jgi:hypothetical protein
MQLLDLNEKQDNKEPLTNFDGDRYPESYLIPHLGTGKWDGHFYVSGATGSGKSFLIQQIIANDLRKRAIWYYSDFIFDPSLQILYDQARISKAPNMKFDDPRLEGTIVLFDDCTKKENLKLRDDLLEKGRHTDTVVFCVNHKHRQWKATMIPLNESRWIITFPSANKPVAIKILQGMALNPKDAKAVVNQSVEDGRYLIIHQFFPNILITQKSVINI